MELNSMYISIGANNGKWKIMKVKTLWFTICLYLEIYTQACVSSSQFQNIESFPLKLLKSLFGGGGAKWLCCEPYFSSPSDEVKNEWSSTSSSFRCWCLIKSKKNIAFSWWPIKMILTLWSLLYALMLLGACYRVKQNSLSVRCEMITKAEEWKM